MRQHSIWTKQLEQIRETLDTDTIIAFRTIFPDLIEPDAI